MNRVFDRRATLAVCGFLLFICWLSYHRAVYRPLGGNTNDKKDVRSKYVALASRFVGKQFPVATLRDAVFDSPRNTHFKESTVVILLGISGCNPCQTREIRNLEELYQRTNSRMKIIALLTNENKYEALLLRKVTSASFPFWYGEDSSLAKFNFIGKYPLVVLLRNQKVLWSFIPISTDDMFSTSALDSLYLILGKEKES